MQGGMYMTERPFPFHTAFRFLPCRALFRFTPFPFRSVSRSPVSEVFRFIPFRILPCRSFSVSFRFVIWRVTDFRFVSFLVVSR